MSKHDDFCDNRLQSYLVWGESRANKTVANPNVLSKLDWMGGRAWEMVDREVNFDTPPPSSIKNYLIPSQHLPIKRPQQQSHRKGRLLLQT